jgi:hypothetical protein
MPGPRGQQLADLAARIHGASVRRQRRGDAVLVPIALLTGSARTDFAPRVDRGDDAAMTATAWTSDELDLIGAAEELEIDAQRADGTLRRPVPIWVVRVGDDLYVRSWRGSRGGWFRAVQRSHGARVRARGLEKDVALLDASEADHDAIDSAFRDKYARYPSYVGPMIAPQARAATLKLLPRAGAHPQDDEADTTHE